ncbi:hypothetical protein Patl1_25179 [Pistacia atlantica]|uniref:Uncharacterized protein n=1 Tax=Pistacia atlantica TaxID=434234 RepID=A0ACC1B532_9ROSI|nr:hypothetical protein Patl1_25179 [Pistacia atlantica]
MFFSTLESIRFSILQHPEVGVPYYLKIQGTESTDNTVLQESVL